MVDDVAEPMQYIPIPPLNQLLVAPVILNPEILALAERVTVFVDERPAAVIVVRVAPAPIKASSLLIDTLSL